MGEGYKGFMKGLVDEYFKVGGRGLSFKVRFKASGDLSWLKSC